MDWDKSYYSPGKLLITSEYVVIDGARALTLPTRFGQKLSIKETDTGRIEWTANNSNGKPWLEVTMDSSSLSVITSNDPFKAEKLSMILQAAQSLSKSFPKNGAIIETQLDFPNEWGLGSSSTLLCNISKWLSIDAFSLHFKVSNGSGYDIAVGMKSTPLVYAVKNQSPVIEKVRFLPDFREHIYFVYLNQKQISDQEVAAYNEMKKDLSLNAVVASFSRLTASLLETKSLEQFEQQLSHHENMMSHILQRDTVKESLFQMYQGGIVKSLGAWGGDFVMITAQSEGDLNYFIDKGYTTILKFDELILSE